MLLMGHAYTTSTARRLLSKRIHTQLYSNEKCSKHPRVLDLDYLSYICKEGRLDEALEIMLCHRVPISRDNAYLLLQHCAKFKDLQGGRQVQSLISQAGLDSVEVLGNYLIRIYASCGSLLEADQTFRKIRQPSVYTWSAIISAHANVGGTEEAMRLYSKMQQSGLKCDKHVYLAVLKACTNDIAIKEGRQIHQQIIRHGLSSDVVVGSTLVDMYAKCGSLVESQEIFTGLLNLDAVSWGAMIAGFAQHSKGFLALDCFERMQNEGIKPDNVTFSSIIKACSSIGAIEDGRLIHDQILKHGLMSDIVIGSTLIDMYAKCGSMKESRKAFEESPHCNVVSWGALIAGYADHAEGPVAIDCFDKMQNNGVEASRSIFLSMLKACGGIRSIQQGRVIHEQIYNHMFQSDVAIANTLMDMYAKCGSLDEACVLFDRLPNKDVVSWNVITAGYALHDECSLSLGCLQKMQEEGIDPDTVTFPSILKACGSLGFLEQGRLIHEQLLTLGLEHDNVVQNALVDMYSKCQTLEESHKIFEKLQNRDVVSWGAMIAAYAQHGKSCLAMDCFEGMKMEGLNPNAVVFSSILKTCGNEGLLQRGRLYHDQIINNGLELDLTLGSSLVDFYAKCGSLEESCDVFDKLPKEHVVCWNTMIAGYAQFGHGLLALDCFGWMVKVGTKPDEVTFLSILVACCRAGLADEGHWYYEYMNSHEILAELDHYNSMVDLLGHAGHFKEAKHFLKSIRQPNTTGWMSLFGACRMHGNVELGNLCFSEVVSLDPCDASAYILMSNILADSSMRADSERVGNADAGDATNLKKDGTVYVCQ